MTPAADQGLAHARTRYYVVARVLIFVAHGDEVLLIKGAADKKIWPGLYHGWGGHLERGESVHAAARRELLEEAGIDGAAPRLRGVLTVDAGPAPEGIVVFVFTAQAGTRETTASPEGGLEWVRRDLVATLPVVEDVPTLLARLWAEPADSPPFSAHYRYDGGGRQIIEFDDEKDNFSQSAQ